MTELKEKDSMRKRPTYPDPNPNKGHDIAHAKGGTIKLENLFAICSTCNKSQHVLTLITLNLTLT